MFGIITNNKNGSFQSCWFRIAFLPTNNYFTFTANCFYRWFYLHNYTNYIQYWINTDK